MRLIPLIVVCGALAGGCKKGAPSYTVEQLEVSPSDASTAVEPEVVEPAPDAAPAEPPPAPEKPILPPTEKEKAETWDQFLTEGVKFVKSMSNERIDILTQMREIKFEKETEAYKKQVSDLADKLQDFELGNTAEKLETAPERMCALITEMRDQASVLLAAGQSDLEKVGADLKAIDEKLAAGDKVGQKQIDKLEELQKRLSGPPLAGRYVLLTVKSIIDEAMVIVDYGVQRARRKLVECLSKIAEKPLDLDLAEQNLEHVIARAKKMLAIPLQ
ncbi:MAG: hypothetical protein U1F43_03675 [Myxococcota bacterium]